MARIPPVRGDVVDPDRSCQRPHLRRARLIITGRSPEPAQARQGRRLVRKRPTSVGTKVSCPHTPLKCIALNRDRASGCGGLGPRFAAQGRCRAHHPVQAMESGRGRGQGDLKGIACRQPGRHPGGRKSPGKPPAGACRGAEADWRTTMRVEDRRAIIDRRACWRGSTPWPMTRRGRRLRAAVLDLEGGAGRRPGGGAPALRGRRLGTATVRAECLPGRPADPRDLRPRRHGSIYPGQSGPPASGSPSSPSAATAAANWRRSPTSICCSCCPTS